MQMLRDKAHEMESESGQIRRLDACLQGYSVEIDIRPQPPCTSTTRPRRRSKLNVVHRRAKAARGTCRPLSSRLGQLRHLLWHEHE
jgi:hypothetical protein